ncbi:feruloyl esterase, putative [Aspergillus oryzae 100-8]|uniref:Carboxylic ester hydrolase n=1 Tax=Aspergillus oryzae (strain 3.042) TaxID=1160506 RepID=I8A0H6_ASPO3|nr:feruloyl esterase [Aspergillus oryzae 3.042]KDE77435.1 feruloyl esterase, putative [Aspergillus oryzae 100-8]|eukprot:EIT78072.1 feruloyl esterase [Aspergillus oryzae 3.042]
MNITSCSPAAIQSPTVFGAEILSLSASWVTNYTLNVPAGFNYNHGDVDVRNAQFCNITVTYTHPGYNDQITVETWLPPRTKWNGRLQATGGGGWQAGRFVLSQFFMSGAIGEGYAATTTDAGLGDAVGPSSWALQSPGNVDYVAFNNLGSRSLNDQAIIGKSLVNSFYGRAPDYAYWSGCSQGGRQGLMLAQRYPTAYDGIVASAPAQSWTKFVSALYYPLLMRQWHGVNPLACELDFLTTEAVAACDAKDGIVDGLISNLTACEYSPYTSVNKTFTCSALNKTMALSPGAALITDAAWSGPQTADGERLWYGVNPGADISQFGSVPGVNSSQSDMWFNLFVAKNASFDTIHMSPKVYEEFFHLGTQEYASTINAADPDLTAFRKAGGKLLTYHGMADESIPTKGTEFYYKSVQNKFPDVQDFYRYFESPGLGHCSGGKGGQPTTIFDALRRWVENGTAPETLPVEYARPEGELLHRIVCPYPAQAKYMGGDISSVESFRCV